MGVWRVSGLELKLKKKAVCSVKSICMMRSVLSPQLGNSIPMAVVPAIGDEQTAEQRIRPPTVGGAATAVGHSLNAPLAIGSQSTEVNGSCLTDTSCHCLSDVSDRRSERRNQHCLCICSPFYTYAAAAEPSKRSSVATPNFFLAHSENRRCLSLDERRFGGQSTAVDVQRMVVRR